MASTTNPQHTAHQVAVALVLGAWLAERTTYQVDDVDQLPTYGREAIVRLTRHDDYRNPRTRQVLAEDYVPSDATWAAAMVVLGDRRAGADPFAGFPT